MAGQVTLAEIDAQQGVWLHENLTRPEAEELLNEPAMGLSRHKPVGSFVIRKSSTGVDWVLTIKTAIKPPRTKVRGAAAVGDRSAPGPSEHSISFHSAGRPWED